MHQIRARGVHPVHGSPLVVIIELIEHVVFAVIFHQTVGVVGPAFLDGVVVLATVGFVVILRVRSEFVDIQTIGPAGLAIGHRHGDPVDAFGYRNVVAFLIGPAVHFECNGGTICLVCCQINCLRIIFHILDPGGRFREELRFLVHGAIMRTHCHVRDCRCGLFIQVFKFRVLEGHFGVPVQQAIVSFGLDSTLSQVTGLHGVVTNAGHQGIVYPVLHIAINAYHLQMIGIRLFHFFFINELQSLICLPAPEFGFVTAGIHIHGITFFAVFRFTEAEQQTSCARVGSIGHVGFVNEVFAIDTGNQESVTLVGGIRNQSFISGGPGASFDGGFFQVGIPFAVICDFELFIRYRHSPIQELDIGERGFGAEGKQTDIAPLPGRDGTRDTVHGFTHIAEFIGE